MDQNSLTSSRSQIAVDAGIVAAAPHAIRFSRGLPGFEACRSFVLMAPEGDGPLQYLKALEGPPASFLVIDPRRVDPTYRCELGDSDRQQLGADADSVLLWLALVSVEADGTIAANLRAPIVINPIRMVGQQVIPHESAYLLRHVLAGPDTDPIG
jgi:flagellar assembly factor FliW